MIIQVQTKLHEGESNALEMSKFATGLSWIAKETICNKNSIATETSVRRRDTFNQHS